jgi:hypothetical protein
MQGIVTQLSGARGSLRNFGLLFIKNEETVCESCDFKIESVPGRVLMDLR